MRYSEFRPLKPFRAQVRLKTDKGMVQLITWADSSMGARRNLGHLYGRENVISVSEITLAEAKQLTSQDQQVKALQTQAKQLKQQAKLTRARKQVQQAQDQLKKAALTPKQVQP